MTTSDIERDPELIPYLTLDDRAGPAQRISRDRALAMVDAALAQVPEVVVTTTRRTPKLGRPAIVAAGIVLGVAFGAAAARWYFPDEPPPPPAAPTAPTVPPRVSVRPAPTPEPALAPAELAEPTERPAETDNSPEPSRSAASERPAPEDLLQKANRLRTLGRFREAAQTYGSVADRYPNTLSAYVAQVAAASIELEHLNNPARARRLYERALREHPEGALDLEARQGLATALRDLGEKSAEITVLQKLIDMHGGSPAARRATERLKELRVR